MDMVRKTPQERHPFPVALRKNSPMLFTSLLLAGALQAAPGGASGLLNAGQLKDRCESGTAADISYCFAYIAGVHDTVRAYESWLNLREFCTPGGISQGELRRAFLDYLNEKPGFRAGEAASVVVVSLKQRYPCSVAAAKPAKP